MVKHARHTIISIHALARRATCHRQTHRGRTNISIHALARRATILFFRPLSPPLISIHALARRATHSCRRLLRRQYNFNPRSRKESDSGIKSLSPTFGHFNPRSRKESDLEFQTTLNIPSNFNPRSRKESDIVRRYIRQSNHLFQSTLSQGERRLCSSLLRVRQRISIHALARRATLLARLQ